MPWGAREQNVLLETENFPQSRSHQNIYQKNLPGNYLCRHSKRVQIVLSFSLFVLTYSLPTWYWWKAPICITEPLNGDLLPGQLCPRMSPAPLSTLPNLLGAQGYWPLCISGLWPGHSGWRLARGEGKRGQGADSPSPSLEGYCSFAPPFSSPLCTAPVLSSCGVSNCSLQSTFQALSANSYFPVGDCPNPLYFSYTLLLPLQVVPFLNPLKLPTFEHVICFLLGPLLIKQLIKLLNIVISVEDGAQYLRTVEN